MHAGVSFSTHAMPCTVSFNKKILLNTEIDIVNDDVEEGDTRPACCKSAELSPCNLQVFGADLFNGDIEGSSMILVRVHQVGSDSTDFCWGKSLLGGLSDYLSPHRQQDNREVAS
jgi:hypothetical protein